MLLYALLLFLLHHLSLASLTLPQIQYSITRRGGSFPAPEIANLTFLLAELNVVESRFNATTRGYQDDGVTLVRKPRRRYGTQSDTILLGDAGREGNWFATLEIGDPPQTVDMDLDMLTADWWILSTRSGTGSFFLDFNSRTYQDPGRTIPFPNCREPTDAIHLPTIERSVPIQFAHCKPAKQWIRSLLPSGAYLGLAAGASVRQTKTTSLLTQVLEKGVVDKPLFSLLLNNGQHGYFNIGGVTTRQSSHAPTTEDTFNYNRIEGHQEVKRAEQVADRRPEDWKWLNLHDNEGWWKLSMKNVWINGAKILEDQLVVLDINTPFFVAPPHAVKTFYAKIFGSHRLAKPYDQFWAYPCSNPPAIHFEFDGLKVGVWKGKRDPGTFSPGGRFSLGRFGSGSRHCIGVMVESRFKVKVKKQVQDEREIVVGWDRDDEEGHGLEDLWIVGEGFFKDVQVAFDWKKKLIGLQRL